MLRVLEEDAETEDACVPLKPDRITTDPAGRSTFALNVTVMVFSAPGYGFVCEATRTVNAGSRIFSGSASPASAPSTAGTVDASLDMADFV
jgi:hypothetical protein